jgi:hypothetical protein
MRARVRSDRVAASLVRPLSVRWRERLLSTVAVGALSLAITNSARTAPDACLTDGVVATCTGDQSAGIASGADFAAPPVTTLNVNNLTNAIAPASGTPGIYFNSTGDITITSNTAAFGITTSGNFARGISASSTS